ncbi:energy-coupling factor ABC transporter ATP-binding protein (plasmid) [Clostridium perfringens]|uniref:ABC transporter ATP-binding protein n=3 Tax=Clostridium perfringens TaxID=1502 RepID=A0AAN3ZQX3_CLOPF|nr:ABC transporter ATP-binding protein [Clostridium perfringens]EDT14774.1 cobalt import ATP-binding protein CbiO [Clostridium perfringens E str. JGS1987]EDT23107.1 cobalt import ATP-binding protein CbiO [Clostridium perfringens B str. ATCC 3626]ELC8333209.1 ABC transporter ATP-binding protein [Clostridium perfringens]ELC8463943.1 ABC transporter ATP-binding protein [Clostridium perfringens]MDK0554368.1 ABC transporter ATP-binding protein [Clostridium perfringens]
MIKLENLSFKYKDGIVLEDINLTINKGEAIALIGPNGSGKTTLLKILNGILIPTKGKYILDKEEITKKKLEDNLFSKRFHKKIGFIFQNSDVQLFCPDVYDEISFGPMQMGLSEEEIDIRVNDCLKLLSIEKLRHKESYKLSGGEKKRVAIASVLALNPEILVLDEPLNEIDPKGKKFIKELLVELNKSGKTIICSTHEFEYIKDVFNRAIVFSEEHKIIRDDTFNNICSDKQFLEDNNII